MYWRIPVTLTPQILQDYCDMIQQALENTLEIETEQSVPESAPIESSDDEDVFNKLRAMTKTNNPEDEKAEPDNLKTSQHRSPAILDSENESESVQFTIQDFNVETEESNTDVMMNTSAAIQGSDDDSDDMPALVISEDQEDELNTSVRKKSKNIIDSDSEEEDGHRETEKRLRSTSSSDTEKPVTKRGRIIDSDED